MIDGTVHSGFQPHLHASASQGMQPNTSQRPQPCRLTVSSTQQRSPPEHFDSPQTAFLSSDWLESMHGAVAYAERAQTGVQGQTMALDHTFRWGGDTGKMQVMSSDDWKSINQGVGMLIKCK